MLQYSLILFSACQLMSLAVINSSHYQPLTQQPEIVKQQKFEEGVLYTRISFPGNILNEQLSKIDFQKGNITEQLKAWQELSNSKAYADKITTRLNAMTAEERACMGSMVMATMMSPLYAKIYYTPGKVLAKAQAMNYTLESFMNTKHGKGKMVVIANNKSTQAAIVFSADNMRKVWEKEAIDIEQYDMKHLPEQEKIAGYLCKKIVYTYKDKKGNVVSTFGKKATKVTVWYNADIPDEINFLHPFYFQLDKGILKIEVHYDKMGMFRMLYEVTGMESKPLSEKDFLMSTVEPVVDWDANPLKASMSILNAMMGSTTNED